MMRVEPPLTGFVLEELISSSNVKRKLSISIKEMSISPPPFSTLEDSSKSLVTIQVACPPSPPLEEVSPPVSRVSQIYDHTPSSSTTPELKPLVAVIGVGYVGTHLVEAFAHHYEVIAFDLSEKRLLEVAEQLDDLPIHFTSCASELSRASHFLISVPTLLNADMTIDTTYLRSAVATVEKFAKAGSTIVVESSVAVGMTCSIVGPLMRSKGFLVGMSPERVDPG